MPIRLEHAPGVCDARQARRHARVGSAVEHQLATGIHRPVIEVSTGR